MKKNTAHTLLKQVKSDYNHIAKEFSDTRYRSWDEFKYFAPYLKPDQHILDLGCGNGRFLNFLEHEYSKTNASFHYTGIDNSENLLAAAKVNHPNALFIQGDQLKIPYEDNHADLIFNIAAFHHIPSPFLRLKALGEMHRVLKKDGYLILTVWNLWQKKYWKAIIMAFWKYITSFGDYAWNDFFITWGKPQEKTEQIKRYYHSFLPSELLKLLKKSDFEIVESFAVKKGKKVSFLKSFNFCVIAKKL